MISFSSSLVLSSSTTLTLWPSHIVDASHPPPSACSSVPRPASSVPTAAAAATTATETLINAVAVAPPRTLLVRIRPPAQVELAVLRRRVWVQTEQRHEVEAEEIVDRVAGARQAGGQGRSGTEFVRTRQFHPVTRWVGRWPENSRDGEDREVVPGRKDGGNVIVRERGGEG